MLINATVFLLLLITTEGDGDGRLHLDGYRPEATGSLGRRLVLQKILGHSTVGYLSNGDGGVEIIPSLLVTDHSPTSDL